jgi:WD40 repeat protein
LLASASDDGLVILWDVATGVQHGTMYSWGKEWVVTTPAGDFACSDGAMKDLSWVADGKLLPADAFAAEHRKQAVRLAP